MEHIQKNAGRARPEKKSLSVGLACGQSEILDAQRLRYRVFAGEMGANLPSRTPGVDHDIYDPYCEHLVVRDTQSGEVVGTYRILPPENARQVGYYSENEFDLTRLQHLRSRLVEIGRSCVHPDYRTGGTITLLWSGLAQYMTERGYDYLMGCASISMAAAWRWNSRPRSVTENARVERWISRTPSWSSSAAMRRLTRDRGRPSSRAAPL